MIKEKGRMEKINRHLISLITYVKLENKNGMFDINKYCEDFFCDLVNIIYDVELQNLNRIKVNHPAVDLGDPKKRVAYQVTSEYSLGKIKETVGKFIEHELYIEYDKLFILILGDKKTSQTKIDTQGKFEFSIKDNVFYLTDISAQISLLKKKKKKKILKYLKNNLEYVDGKKGRGTEKRKEISDKFKKVISYIIENDFHFPNFDILVEIDSLNKEYCADEFFIKQKSTLLSDLSSLSQIVVLYTQNDVLKGGDEVKNEIYKLRKSIVNEYVRIILKK